MKDSSPSTAAQRGPFLSDTAILVALAFCLALLHIFTNDQYGFHRDELATLDDARHLAWGYVAYPPVTRFWDGFRWRFSEHRSVEHASSPRWPKPRASFWPA